MTLSFMIGLLKSHSLFTHTLNSSEFENEPDCTIGHKRRMQTQSTGWKVSKYGGFSSPYFPVFGLNTESYSIDWFLYEGNTGT